MRSSPGSASSSGALRSHNSFAEDDRVGSRPLAQTFVWKVNRSPIGTGAICVADTDYAQMPGASFA